MSCQETIQIWVYDDQGVSELSMRSALSAFNHKLLTANISNVRTISSQEILQGQLSGKGCLVMPGGADLPYCDKLNGYGNKIIKKFIAQGNVYIGICAGGYYGARDIAFTGKNYTVHGARELAFFQGTAIGSIAMLTNGQLYDETTASKGIAELSFHDSKKDYFYYHGGAHYVSDEVASLNIIAQYADGSNAVVSGDYGQGKYLLSGVHFELCADIYAQHITQTLNHNQSTKHPQKELELLALLSIPTYGHLIFKEIEKLLKGIA